MLSSRPADVLTTPLMELQVCDELSTAGVSRFREWVHEVLDLQPEVLVVDLSRCPWFDSQALAVLLAAHRIQCRRGASLVLRGVDERGMRMLALTGLHRVFTVE